MNITTIVRINLMGNSNIGDIFAFFSVNKFYLSSVRFCFSQFLEGRPEAAALRCFIKKGFLKISQNSLESSLRPATLQIKRLRRRCFPVNFGKSFKDTFFRG